jgi:hypothetical protein
MVHDYSNEPRQAGAADRRGSVDVSVRQPGIAERLP